MFYLTILLFVVALILLAQAQQKQKETGLPGGQIIYTDTQTWEPVEKPLTDSSIGLTGKPDYIVKNRNQVIPIEVKSSRIGQAPYDSHIYQLAAYCRLIEKAYNHRPAYGILHYPNRTFQIEYTPELEENLLNLMYEMRAITTRKQADRSHQNAQRCNRCGYRSMCDAKLA